MHVDAWQSTGRADITAICDVNLSQCEKFAKETGLRPKVYSGYKEMIESEHPEILDICTPPFYHTEAALYALQRKIPVMIEKPLCVTSSEADRIIKVSEENSVPVFVIHNYSIVPSIIRAKRIIKQGRIGDITSISALHLVPPVRRYLTSGHWAERYPLGIMGDLAPHVVMYVLDLAQEPVSSVIGYAERSASSLIAYDEMFGIIKFNGIVGTFSILFNCPANKTYLTISGTLGSIIIDAENQTLSVIDKPVSSDSMISRGTRAWKSQLSLLWQTTSLSFQALAGKMPVESFGHRFLASAALDHLDGVSVYPIDVHRARDVVWVLEQIGKQIQ
jgi:predicted dehydrogenase